MKKLARVRTIGAIAASGALLSGTALLVAESPASAAGPVTLFSSGTPGTASVAVPSDVCFVSVTADGGHGAQGFGWPHSCRSCVDATRAVTSSR